MSSRQCINCLLGAAVAACVAFVLAWSNPATACAPNRPPEDEGSAQRDDEKKRPPLGGPKRRGREPERAQGAERDEAEDTPRLDNVQSPSRRGRFGPRGRTRDEEGRRGRRGSRDFRGPGDEPSAEMIDRAMEVLETELPEWHERLAKLRERNPRRFQQMMMTKVMPVMREYMSLRDRKPELARGVIKEFKIEHQLRQLSREYRRAEEDPARRARIEERIGQLVQAQVEIHMQRRIARLQEATERLQREKRKLEEDRENLQDLVARRVERIKHGRFRDDSRGRGRRRGGPRDFDEDPPGPPPFADRPPRSRPDDRPRNRRPPPVVDEED